jgi:DNA-binding NarL/FixJ family response regulator
MQKASPAFPSVRVVIADSHELTSRLLQLMLTDQPNIHVVGSARTYDGALELAERSKPDVMLIDVDVEDAEFCPRSKSRLAVLYAHRVLAMSTLIDDEARETAARFGACRLIDKFCLVEDLVPAILDKHEPS